MKVPHIKQKYQDTIQQKYGVKCVFQSDEIKSKIKESSMQKYGMPYHIASDIVKDTIKKSVKLKYNVDNVAQVAKFRSNWKKSAFKHKIYVSESGKEFTYQGYEYLVIKLLLQNGIHEDDIFTEHELCSSNTMPEFWYIINEGNHRYFPDIYVKSQNKFIEIKSTYTFDIDPERVYAKADCVWNNDYNFDLYVFNGKHEIVHYEQLTC
jgi:hypothetical protein